MALTLPPYITRIVWSQAYSSLSWLQGQVVASGSASSPPSLVTKATLVLESLAAGTSILTINDILLACSALLPGVQQAGALPITYNPAQSAAISNTISNLAVFPGYLSSLVPLAFPAAPSSLAAGSPSLYLQGAYQNLTEAFLSASLEIPPLAYDGSWGSLQTSTESLLETWDSIVNSVSGYYGAFPQSPLDSVTRIGQGIAAQTSIITGLAPSTAPAYLPPAISWNQAVVVPSLASSCRLVQQGISTNPGQGSMVTRAFLATMAQQVASFAIIVAGLGAASTAATTTTQQGQGLMDIASQFLGNQAAWRGITSGVQPPWGAGAIPTGTTVNLVPGSTAKESTYAQILGSDINLGSQNNPMPSWSGDFDITVGIPNYISALGRRLATTLGALIYHPQYGCRIPPEIGEIMTTGANSLIATFGAAAIQSDPRTQSLVSATASSIPGNPNAVGFQATVQPIGPGISPVSLNEVITSPVGSR